MSDKMQNQIEAIMDKFDFDRVQKIMKASNWQWATGEGDEKELPSGNDIRRSARRMLNRVIIEKLATISSGGFTAMKIKNKQGEQLVLFFGVDSLDVDFEDW